MPAVSDPERRPPAAAIGAAVLALPTAFFLLAVGNAALAIAGSRRADGGGAATWIVLLLTFGWTAAVLIGAVRLLLGRAWFGLVFTAVVFAALLTVGVILGGGFGGSGTAFTLAAWVVSVGTAVCAALPAVRHWVARRRQNRLYPGSVQRSASRS